MSRPAYSSHLALKSKVQFPVRFLSELDRGKGMMPIGVRLLVTVFAFVWFAGVGVVGLFFPRRLQHFAVHWSYKNRSDSRGSFLEKFNRSEGFVVYARLVGGFSLFVGFLTLWAVFS